MARSRLIEGRGHVIFSCLLLLLLRSSSLQQDLKIDWSGRKEPGSFWRVRTPSWDLWGWHWALGMRDEADSQRGRQAGGACGRARVPPPRGAQAENLLGEPGAWAGRFRCIPVTCRPIRWRCGPGPLFAASRPHCHCRRRQQPGLSARRPAAPSLPVLAGA